MRTSSYRAELPFVFGVVAAFLMVWQLHNEEIIHQNGMGWDDGAPIWPYETPGILVYGFYSPAHILAAPLFWVFDLRTAGERYAAILPCSLLWWHLVGRRLDFGLAPSSWRRLGKRIAVIPLLVGLVFASYGSTMALKAARWWSQYGDRVDAEYSMVLIYDLGPAMWCIVVAAWLGFVAFRMAARE